MAKGRKPGEYTPTMKIANIIKKRMKTKLSWNKLMEVAATEVKVKKLREQFGYDLKFSEVDNMEENMDVGDIESSSSGLVTGQAESILPSFKELCGRLNFKIPFI